MSKRYLTVEKALVLFQELPSDDDSIVSFESSADEYYVSQSYLCNNDLLSDSDREDEVLEVNVPGPSTPQSVKWVKDGKGEPHFLHLQKFQCRQIRYWNFKIILLCHYF